MADHDTEPQQEGLESLREMNLKEEEEEADGDVGMDNIEVAEPVKEEHAVSASVAGGSDITTSRTNGQIWSHVKASSTVQSPMLPPMGEEVIGGDVTLKLEPGKPPKLSRTIPRKIERRAPPLFNDYDDSTAEACASFALLSECTYANKSLGTTEPALECDCSEEWDATTHTNDACGEDSDCINRATKMECIEDCGCGTDCQNRRFQRKTYASVSVIKTEKKGFGLRANADLAPDDFIFEYIGEVIGENIFRRRMQQYDEEGIKHFYFMSLTKGEFVDATRRGNLGRFCNHSCNPNCYVDKWVVNDKLRMGIFAERRIKAGEELVFNYNVDRYGADPQPCYCGEPNCTGYIGGKTQTERATKLSNAIIEALGIDEADAWDTAVAKKPRKKKQGEDDEEYVNNLEPRGLDEEGVNKVMSSLMQCKEKWIAVKLLSRIQRAGDERVRNRVVRFHGYRIMKTVLANFAEDVNVCLQILEILDMMPRLTRNKIQDSRIEEAVAPLRQNEDERVAARATGLMDAWSKLEIGYRIPRMKRDPHAAKIERVERRDVEERRRRSKSRSKSPDRGHAPNGPRGNAPSRGGGFFGGPRPPPRYRPPPPSNSLPPGWFEATAANGTTYYYNQSGTTTWQRPVIAATGAPPPPPPKAVSDQQMLHDLIKNIVESKKEVPKSQSLTATPAETPKKERKEDRWKSYPLEKRKKLYEGAIQPHLMHVVGKYKHKLAKDDLKRWAKELAKKMVEGDFKKGRVADPTKISDKQAKNIKKHAQDFFEKAVKKKADADQRKAKRAGATSQDESNTPTGSPHAAVNSPMEQDDLEITLSDNEADDLEATPAESTSSVSAAKRRMDDTAADDTDTDTGSKRQRTESEDAQLLPPPPPPPPPPPVEPYLPLEDDVSGAFTHEAISAVYNATFSNGQAPLAVEHDDGESQSISFKQQLGFDETLQIATPPTTGSPDIGHTEKLKHQDHFTGMNPERLKLLESSNR